MVSRSRRALLAWGGTAAVAVLAGCGGTLSPAATASQPSVVASVATLAPDIPISGAENWYNSPPLTLAGLRGAPVLLVFWSDI